MECHWCWVATVLCFLVPRGRCCRLVIVPEEPVVEFGASILFNCTSSCRDSSRLGWEVSVTKVEARGPGWVSLSVPNVTHGSLEVQCYGILSGHRQVAATTLRAYRLSPPRLYQDGDAVAGEEARVTCDVSAQVAPPDAPNLTLTLRGGGLPPAAGRGPSLAATFTARPEQHGREVTCDAKLRLGNRAVSAGTNITLRVWAAPHSVQVSATRTVFAAGDNLTVTCRAEGNPPPRFRWELPANASLHELPGGGRAVTVPSAQRENAGAYRCLAQNRYGTGAASIELVFQGSPGSVLIAVTVALAVVVVLAGSWWFYRTGAWKPTPRGR